MPTTDALNLALAGLDVTRARIDTISRNVSNANTDGYTAKTQSQVVGPLGEVMTGPIQRNVNQTLLASLQQTTGQANQLGVTVNLLSDIENAFGTPNSDTSLSSAITNLQNAFQDLSVNPEQSALYGAVTDAAAHLASNLNSLSQTVSTTTTNAQQQLTDAVTTVNLTLQQIQQVNLQIAQQRTGSDVTDLEDQRDKLISTVAGYLDVTTFAKPNGETAVYTRDGKPLVDAVVATLSVAANGAIQWNASNAAPAPVRVGSGTIGGLTALEATTLPAVQAKLDDIARALTVEFDNINVPLFNDGGTTALNPLDPVQLKGYAGRITVNQAVLASPTILRDSTATTVNVGQMLAFSANPPGFANNDTVTVTSRAGAPLVFRFVDAAAAPPATVNPGEIAVNFNSAGPPPPTGAQILGDLATALGANGFTASADPVTGNLTVSGNEADPVNDVAVRIAAGTTATETVVTAPATPRDPGDTTNIDAALALFSRTDIAFTPSTGLPASGSFVDVATGFISSQSTQRADAQSQLDGVNTLQQSLKNKVSAQSGVNVDNEVAQLALFQNTYAANARVLQTTQDLFNTLFQAMSG